MAHYVRILKKIKVFKRKECEGVPIIFAILAIIVALGAGAGAGYIYRKNIQERKILLFMPNGQVFSIML